MRRREFVLLLGAQMTAAGKLRAQQKALPVIGFLSFGTLPLPAFTAAFRNGLSETGHVEGQNVTIEYRWGDYEQLPQLAGELVSRKVNVIATSGGGPAARAAKSATSTIPIVFVGVGDPVADGLIVSLAHPGRNLTGFSTVTLPSTSWRNGLSCCPNWSLGPM